MQDNIVLDVNEDDINQLNRDLLATLLFDRTTRKNILWGTDDYKDLGDAYAAGNPITEYLITGSNGKVIQPAKSAESAGAEKGSNQSTGRSLYTFMGL